MVKIEGGITVRHRDVSTTQESRAKHQGRVRKMFSHTSIDPQRHTIISEVNTTENYVGLKGWPRGWMTLWPHSEIVFDFEQSLFLTMIKFTCVNIAASPREMELYTSNSPDGPWRLVYQFEMCDRYRQPRDIASDNNRDGLSS